MDDRGPDKGSDSDVLEKPKKKEDKKEKK